MGATCRVREPGRTRVPEAADPSQETPRLSCESMTPRGKPVVPPV